MLGFKFEFYILLRYGRPVVLLKVNGTTFLQYFRGYWQPGVKGYWQHSDKFVGGCQRVLATPLTNSSGHISNCCKQLLLFPGGIEYPVDIYKRVAQLTKKRATF
jgi:hypothetical protein